jgi:membrane protease YdiL (CAAX protease family)
MTKRETSYGTAEAVPFQTMADPEQEPLDPSHVPPPEIAPVWNEDPTTLQLVPADEALPALPQREAFPAWSGWDVMAVLCFTLASVFLFSMAALGVAHLLSSKQHVSFGDLATSPIVVIGSQVAAYPVVIVFVIVLVGTKSRERFWSAIRWNWGGAGMIRFLLSGAIFAFAVEFASRWLPIPKSMPVDKLFTDSAGAYLMAVFGVTLAPLLEELFFRGMLYPLIRRGYGVLIGVLLTGAAFASIHGAQLGYAWGPLLSIFVVGVVFTLVRERTDSVAASFLMHCGYNFTLFTMLWLASDHFRHLEKVAS